MKPGVASSVLESATPRYLAVVVTMATIVAVVMPATTTAMREKEAAAHAQHDQQWNQQCDSTEHFKIL